MGDGRRSPKSPQASHPSLHRGEQQGDPVLKKEQGEDVKAHALGHSLVYTIVFWLVCAHIHTQEHKQQFIKNKKGKSAG